MKRVQPIVFTPHADRWVNVLSALGMSTLVNEPEWKVLQADAGRIALHSAESPRVELWFDSTTPEEDCSVLSTAGGTIKEVNLGERFTVWEAHFGEAVLGLSTPYSGDDIQERSTNGLSVFPLWLTPTVSKHATALADLGLSRRISSDGGGWVDFVADDGLVAVHWDENELITLAFEYTGDLSELATSLESSGIACRLIDEAFAQTLRIDHPDGGDEIWINAPQDDLYGYTQHS